VKFKHILVYIYIYIQSILCCLLNELEILIVNPKICFRKVKNEEEKKYLNQYGKGRRYLLEERTRNLDKMANVFWVS
jgi:hypothetical protein